MDGLITMTNLAVSPPALFHFSHYLKTFPPFVSADKFNLSLISVVLNKAFFPCLTLSDIISLMAVLLNKAES